MVNNWADWDKLRASRGHLQGQHTSKEGLTALEGRGIALTYGGGRTTVRRHGQNIGTITHPDHPGGMFNVYASDVRKIDDMGKFSHSGPLADTSTHDAAIESVLRAHSIEPPPRRSADRIASIVTGPAVRSVVARAHTGRRAAPSSEMSTASRAADSIATRIRMNSARTDPMTGEKITASTRSADQVAKTVDRPMTAARLKKMYSGIFKIHRKKAAGTSPTIDRHTRALTASPDYHHELVRDSMLKSPSGGIHVGDKRAIDMAGTRMKTLHDQGVTILKDRPNHKIGGVYSSDVRQLLVPDDTHSGSVSTASHEFGHALDQAYGERLSGKPMFASQLPHFQQVYQEATHMHDNSKTVLNPYYTDKSTSVGTKEMWAEGYAAWLHGRQTYGTPDEQALLIGHELGAAPTEKLRVGRLLQNYFDIQDEKMRELTR